MLQPHSLLWHYLSVAPAIFLSLLAFLMWKRGVHKEFPAFFCYAIFEAVGGRTAGRSGLVGLSFATALQSMTSNIAKDTVARQPPAFR